MGCAPMAHILFSRFARVSPKNPTWMNRDRFVLSNGHGCVLQYVLWHLLGFNISIDDLKSFRQMGSKYESMIILIFSFLELLVILKQTMVSTGSRSLPVLLGKVSVTLWVWPWAKNTWQLLLTSQDSLYLIITLIVSLEMVVCKKEFRPKRSPWLGKSIVIFQL